MSCGFSSIGAIPSPNSRSSVILKLWSCARAVIREVQRLIGQSVDVHFPPLARGTARMFQHRLDDAVGAFAVFGDLLQIAGQHFRNVVDLRALVVVQRGEARCGCFVQFRQQIDRETRKIVNEVQRVLDLVRNAGGQLAQRRHLLRLNQIGLGDLELMERGLDRARGFLRGITRGGDLSFVALAFGDVGEHQHEAASRDRVVADFDHAAVGAGALGHTMLARVRGDAANLVLDIDVGAVIAALGEVADVIAVNQPLLKQIVRHREHFLEPCIPGDQPRLPVEHCNAITHVLERKAQFLLPLREFISASAQFLQQPRILDRDHCLSSEVLQQRDLLVRERPHFLSMDRDKATYSSILQ